MAGQKTLLWSFQSQRVIEIIDIRDVFYADWSYVGPTWKMAYKWMANKMHNQGITLKGRAPVWAWHSCREMNGPPTLAVARNLLTDFQLLSGMYTVEMEVPTELCLISSYGRFNDMLHDYFDNGELKTGTFEDMFEVPSVEKSDCLQAVIPYIRKDWIIDIRPLDIKPGKWDYNWERGV